MDCNKTWAMSGTRSEGTWHLAKVTGVRGSLDGSGVMTSVRTGLESGTRVEAHLVCPGAHINFAVDTQATGPSRRCRYGASSSALFEAG